MGPIIFTQLSRIQTLAAGSEPPARIVRLDPDGRLQSLTEGFASARDPDISFDGKRILFSARKAAGDRWQVYEMAADGSDVRRITDEPMDCRQPGYQSFFYVITADEPWHQVTFVGSSGELPGSLYSVTLDGEGLRRLTFNPYGDTDPYLAPDGRILFSSRQSNRLEGAHGERSALFGVNLDGTDYAIYSGDEGAPWKRMPTVTFEGLVVFVENDKQERDGAGWLSAVTVRRNLHSHRRLSKGDDFLYHSPSPLPDGKLLVSRRPADGNGVYGIYRFDPATGEAEPVHENPGYHSIQPRLLAPRVEPDGRSSVVNEQDPTGLLYCLNVYTTDFRNPQWLPEGAAERLRVVEGIPRPGAGADGSLTPPAKRILGEIAIERDGSFNLRVPANTPIQLQLLDERGLALRTCSWIWVKNKEPRGCIGCHEDGELVPENRVPAAVIKPSIALTLPPERRRMVSFRNNIKPIIEQKCATAACHSGFVPPKLARLDEIRMKLSGTARTSPLAWRLFGKNTSRPWDGPLLTRPEVPVMPPADAAPLTDDEIRTILEWIDLGAE